MTWPPTSRSTQDLAAFERGAGAVVIVVGQRRRGDEKGEDEKQATHGRKSSPAVLTGR